MRLARSADELGERARYGRLRGGRRFGPRLSRLDGLSQKQDDVACHQLLQLLYRGERFVRDIATVSDVVQQLGEPGLARIHAGADIDELGDVTSASVLILQTHIVMPGPTHPYRRP